MDLERKQALLTSSLERAAELLGDITPAVMERFYERHPNAGTLFEELYPGSKDKLEGEMVEQALYCLMEWYASPGEVEIILITTVPHHMETLHVDPQLFTAMITAVCDTIATTIPAGETGELAVWQELNAALLELVETQVRHSQQHRKAMAAR